jgi:hypothetical protein
MSGLNQAGDIIGKNANSRTLLPAAVGSQVALMTLVSVSAFVVTLRLCLTCSTCTYISLEQYLYLMFCGPKTRWV